MAVLALDIVLFPAAFAFMEGFAWFTHKYVMHGFMWVWHRSHHEPRHGVFELNDLFAAVFATPAIVAIYFGVHGYAAAAAGRASGSPPTARSTPCSTTAWCTAATRSPLNGKSRFWKRLIQAHRIHHAVEHQGGLRLVRLPDSPRRCAS